MITRYLIMQFPQFNKIIKKVNLFTGNNEYFFQTEASETIYNTPKVQDLNHLNSSSEDLSRYFLRSSSYLAQIKVEAFAIEKLLMQIN